MIKSNLLSGHGLVVECLDGHRGDATKYMNYVYILQSIKNGRYYIGSTSDLERRLLEHNAGKTKSLRNLRPLKLVFKKDFVNLTDARKVEKNLKKLKNKNIIQRIILDGKIKGFAGMV